jgi:hypothetical protein
MREGDFNWILYTRFSAPKESDPAKLGAQRAID